MRKRILALAIPLILATSAAVAQNFEVRWPMLTLPANMQGTVQPESVSFGSVHLGEQSASRQVELRNTGNTGLAFHSASASSPFELSHGCPPQLAPNESCELSLAFDPLSEGQVAGEATISTSAGLFTVQLGGEGTLTDVQLTPASYDFGAVQLEQVALSTLLQLRNTGSAEVHSLTLTPPADVAVHDTNCAAPMAPDATCELVLRFAPTQGQSYSGRLQVAANSLTTNFIVSGVGRAASGSVSPTSLEFGGVLVGASSAASSVSVSNTGVGPIEFAAAGLVGPFELEANACSGSLSAGATCVVSVRYVPTAAGAQSGTLTLPSSAGGHSVTLSGAGLVPGAGLTPEARAFGGVQVGQSVDYPGFTYSNTGNTTFAAVSVAAPEGFSVIDNGCTSLVPGATCTFGIRFSPMVAQPYAGTLTVTAGGLTRSAALSGTGVTPNFSLSQTSQAFGDVQVGSYADSGDITFTNTGTMALSSVSVTAPTGFSIVSNGCTSTIAADGTCTLRVRFAPTTAAPYSGNVSVVAQGVTRTLSVTGTGRVASSTIGPASLAFGDVKVGAYGSDQYVTLTNTGVGAISVSTPTLSGPFSLASNNCGVSLAAGSACSIGVNFAPTASGLASGTLMVANEGGNKSVALSGTGVAPNFKLSPTSFAFGSVRVGSSKDSTAITLTNTGNEAISGVTMGSQLGYALISNGCTGTVAPGGSCTFRVRFAPPMPSSMVIDYYTTLGFKANGVTRTLSVSGTGLY